MTRNLRNWDPKQKREVTKTTNSQIQSEQVFPKKVATQQPKMN